MKIKRLGLESVDSIYEIEQKTQISPWSRESIADVFNYSYYTVLGAYDGAEHLCGFIIFDEIAGESNLHDIAVAPSCQNKGIGSILLSSYLDMLKLHGISRSILEVRVSNDPARHLYGKFNYTEIAIRKNYYKTKGPHKEDAVIMENIL